MTQAQEDLAARVEKLEQGVEVAANLAKEVQALRVEVENWEAWANAAVADLQLGLTRLRIGAGGSVSFLDRSWVERADREQKEAAEKHRLQTERLQDMHLFGLGRRWSVARLNYELRTLLDRDEWKLDGDAWLAWLERHSADA
jgi:hypothetical protein